MIECKIYNKRNYLDWENFIDNSTNGTIFHYRRFIDYHEKPIFKDCSLMFYKKSRLLAVLPGAIIEKKFISHPGTSFGSFVHNTKLSYSDAAQITKSFKNFIENNQFKQTQLTMTPLVYNKSISNYIEFCLYNLSFNYGRLELTNVININQIEENVIIDFKKENRTAVRKAIKNNVIVQQSEKFDEFYSILEKNLKLRHNVAPTHTLKEIIKIKKIFPDQIKLFTAEHENRVVAGVLNFICNSQTILAFYISHDEKFQEFRPLNLLFSEIFKWSKKNKYQFYDFGLFTNLGEPNISLAKFKESFGAEGVFRKTMILG